MINIGKNSKETFTRTERFASKTMKVHADVSPSPGTYKIASDFEKNYSHKKGPAFTKSSRVFKHDNESPGPGAYDSDIFNPEKVLFYTMRKKTKNYEETNVNSSKDSLGCWTGTVSY